VREDGRENVVREEMFLTETEYWMVMLRWSEGSKAGMNTLKSPNEMVGSPWVVVREAESRKMKGRKVFVMVRLYAGTKE